MVLSLQLVDSRSLTVLATSNLCRLSVELANAIKETERVLNLRFFRPGTNLRTETS